MSKKDELQILATTNRPFRSYQALLKKLVGNKRDFLIRETPYMVSLVYNNRETTFTKRNNMFPSNQLWIFKAVKADAAAFADKVLSGQTFFVIPNKYPVNRTNIDYDESVGVITGTDINSAYWTIAHNMGIISDRTYDKANSIEYKVVRLAALAIMGRDIVFKKYVNGELQTDTAKIAGQQIIKDLYKAIRYSCYEHMHTLAEMLGDDFDCYRTDCIYYRDTPDNRKKVYDYLDKYNFFYKQLVYGDEDADSEKD